MKTIEQKDRVLFLGQKVSDKLAGGVFVINYTPTAERPTYIVSRVKDVTHFEGTAEEVKERFELLDFSLSEQ